MRLIFIRYCTSVIFILLHFQPSFAQKKLHSLFNVEAQVGLRVEDMNWSIAGNLEGQNPNVKSELIWSNLVNTDVSFTGSYQVFRKVFLSVGGSIGKTVKGHVLDTDYADSDRNNISYQLSAHSNKGNNSTYHLQAHYVLAIGENIEVEPLVGYSRSSHTYWVQDANIQFSGQSLNSSYRSRWKGPYLGMKSKFYLLDNIFLNAGIKYYQLNYNAEANWNLMKEFKQPTSFVHSAKGYRLQGGLAPAWQMRDNLALYLNIGYSYAVTANGNDIAFLTNGTDVNTRLNKVTQKFWTSNIGLNYNIGKR